MFPVNPQLWADPDYRRDAEALLGHAAEHDVGVMAIKAAGRPAVGPDGTTPRAPGTSRTPRPTRSAVVSLRAVDPRGPRLLHPGGHVGPGHGVGGGSRAHPDEPGELGTAAIGALAAEPGIFPMPAA